MKSHTVILALLIGVIAVSTVEGVAFKGLRRGLQGTKKIVDYAQCGGLGGACNSSGFLCTSGQWEGVECAPNSECVGQTEHYYMCQPKVTNDKPKDGAATLREDGVSVLAPWTQCGGSTGDCTKYGEAACKDCPFPKTTCDVGYVCYRVVEFYWQCGPEAQYSGSASNKCSEEDTLGMASAPTPAVSISEFRACEESMPGMAVQGRRFKAIMMKKDDMNYERCCSYCQEEDQCVAFHLNFKSDKDVVCALFNEFGDTVEHENSVAGMIEGTKPKSAIPAALGPQAAGMIEGTKPKSAIPIAPGVVAGR